MTASITEILNSLRQGVDGAADELVKHFLPMLRRHLAEFAKQLRISDEDDIAISAFYELCTAIEKSRLEDISDRTQLWQMLSIIAIRKANDFRKFEKAEKRGGKAQVLSLENMRHQVASLDQRPELQLELLEQCESFMKGLESSELRQVAEYKLSGYTNAEISEELGVAIRTVQLMVARIKERMLESIEK